MEEWQRNHIRANLPGLLANTNCSVIFLTHFCSRQIISPEELNILINMTHKYEQTSKFYEIIQTRSESYAWLKKFMLETTQTGAYEILNNYNSNYKTCGAISYCKSMRLGQGSIGSVVCRGRFDGVDVAVKMFIVDYIDLKKVKEEVDLMKNIGSHENIVKYLKAEETEESILIALELCSTNLHDWVSQPDSLPISQMDILHQATTGISYLHSNRIIHRDLKPANILMVRSPVGKVMVKISDFGMSRRLQVERSRTSIQTSRVGTEGWVAPEIIRGLENQPPQNAVIFSFSGDIFSLGCIFYFVLTSPKGVHPFGDRNHMQANIADGKAELDEEEITASNVNVSALIELIRSMIAHEGSSRPSISDVLAHLENMCADKYCLETIGRLSISKKKTGSQLVTDENNLMQSNSQEIDIVSKLEPNNSGNVKCTEDTTQTKEVEPIPMQPDPEPIRVLKSIEVEYTKNECPPQPYILEARGGNSDINGGCKGDFVWLRPIWTTDLSEGATGVNIIVHHSEIPGQGKDLAKGAKGAYRYINVLKDPSSKFRITEIALWRNPRTQPEKYFYRLAFDKKRLHKHKPMPTDNGRFQFHTININVERETVAGDLYLCWNGKYFD